jgi:hypothetical protein
MKALHFASRGWPANLNTNEAEPAEGPFYSRGGRGAQLRRSRFVTVEPLFVLAWVTLECRRRVAT